MAWCALWFFLLRMGHSFLFSPLFSLLVCGAVLDYNLVLFLSTEFWVSFLICLCFFFFLPSSLSSACWQKLFFIFFQSLNLFFQEKRSDMSLLHHNSCIFNTYFGMWRAFIQEKGGFLWAGMMDFMMRFYFIVFTPPYFQVFI